MKTLHLTVVLLVIATHAMGVFCNGSNSNFDPMASSGGLVWLSTGGSPALITQDFNAALYAGTNAASLPLLQTLLLSNGSANHIYEGMPGYFAEPVLNAYTIPGAINNTFVEVQAWLGNYNSYNAAVAAGSPAAQTPVFVNLVGIPPSTPIDLIGMPALVLSVPEPSGLLLLGVGGAILLLCRRKIKS